MLVLRNGCAGWRSLSILPAGALLRAPAKLPAPPRRRCATSEERLRLVRRATGLGMYEIDWVARRRYWSPELRAILRVPADLDINADADLLERIVPKEMRARFREKLEASLAPGKNGDYEDEHRITRFDGSTGWILLRGKTFFQEGAGRPAPDALDWPRDRHHRPQARRGGKRTTRLHGAVIERRDLLDRSAPHHQDLESGRRAAVRLHGRGSDRPIAAHDLPGRDARRADRALRADDERPAGAAGDRAPPQGRARSFPSASRARRSSRRTAASPASRRCIAT